MKFLFADMGAEIVLVDGDETGIRRVIARCENPLWDEYCKEYESKHPGSVPSKHGGTMMQLKVPLRG